jgi:hypothetical protein
VGGCPYKNFIPQLPLKFIRRSKSRVARNFLFSRLPWIRAGSGASKSLGVPAAGISTGRSALGRKSGTSESRVPRSEVGTGSRSPNLHGHVAARARFATPSSERVSSSFPPPPPNRSRLILLVLAPLIRFNLPASGEASGLLSFRKLASSWRCECARGIRWTRALQLSTLPVFNQVTRRPEPRNPGGTPNLARSAVNIN